MIRETELDQYKRVASDIRNPKGVREQALRQVRILERAAGIPLSDIVTKK